jgi:predicted HicB family RNase H-like nuclease
MNTLSYKDYIGTVSYSSEDEVFYGKLEHINDLITFESENAHELKKAFEEAVDNYIEFCKEKGVEPERPFKGSFNVRVKPYLHKQAYLKALKSGMTLNKFIETAIENELKE